MKDEFEKKLARVVGTTRILVMDDPHHRYSGGLLYYSNKSEKLHDAAMALEGDPGGRHFEAFALLGGLSLEVLIKGILIGLDEKPPLTHDLVDLSKRAGFAVSNDDRAVLKALTIYVTWYSRYPATKSAQKMIEDLEVLRAQYPSSGSLEAIVNSARTPPSSVNVTNYKRLYEFFSEQFSRVYSSVHEGAVLSSECPDS